MIKQINAGLKSQAACAILLLCCGCALLPDGQWTYVTENGQTLTGKYRYGESPWLRHGTSGQLILRNTDGEKTAEGFIDNREEDGTWIEWGHEGLVRSIKRYRNGARHGATELYNTRSGSVVIESYSNGVPHGVWEFWKGPKTHSLVRYKEEDGRMLCVSETWLDSAELLRRIQYENGRIVSQDGD